MKKRNSDTIVGYLQRKNSRVKIVSLEDDFSLNC